MVQYIPRVNATLALSFALFVGACAKTDTNTAAADSALNKDIQLANRDTAAQPALTDVPASSTAPAPVATAPKPTTTTKTTTTTTTRPTNRTSTGASRPTTSVTASGNTVTRTAAGSAKQVGTIPAGATLNLASGEKICTNTNKVGNRFNATLTNAVTGSNGAVIPEGATATVEVTDLKRSENVNDNVVMGFRVVAVMHRLKRSRISRRARMSRRSPAAPQLVPLPVRSSATARSRPSSEVPLAPRPEPESLLLLRTTKDASIPAAELPLRSTRRLRFKSEELPR